jgi:predicted ArsR family transcriptional regulator
MCGEIMDPNYVSRLITDEYVMKILVSTLNKPMSAQQLALKYEIPIAVCYRKMKELLAADLIQKEKKVLTSKGKWVQLYRSKVKSAYVFLEKGELRVRLELADFETPEMDRSVQVIEPMM